MSESKAREILEHNLNPNTEFTPEKTVNSRILYSMQEYAEWYHSQQSAEKLTITDFFNRLNSVPNYSAKNIKINIHGGQITIDEISATTEQSAEVSEVNWSKLREKFFYECTGQVEFHPPRVDVAPHDLFEWFKKQISIELTKNK